MVCYMKRAIYSLLRDDGERGLANRLISRGIMALIILNVVLVIIEAMQGFPEETSRLFFYIEAVSVIIFTIEYILRLWTSDLMYPRMSSAKARFTYVTSPMAIVDIVAILPFYLPFAFPINMAVLRLLRLLRLLRIFKMNRYSDAATSKIVMSSIQEAVIVLDVDQNVLSANKFGKKLLFGDGSSNDSSNKQSYVHISKIERWPAELALTGEETTIQTMDFEMPGDKFYSATISPILIKGKLLKQVVIIRDVTEIVLLERAEKERIKSVFSRFVSPDVVNELVEGDVDIQLGGTLKNVSVLFVDIRGFTAFSEINSPENVVGMVNRYLSLTSSSIQDNDGMIDKYIGDATMAIFGAPNELDNHALCACRAAWAMKQGSAVIQKEIHDKYGVDLQFGVGINSGDAVVGNMGSEFRMDYTAIGDTVNTAARLESNSQKGQIIISEATYQRVKDYVKVTNLGVLNVKNKKVGIQIYSLDGLVEEA